MPNGATTERARSTPPSTRSAPYLRVVVQVVVLLTLALAACGADARGVPLEASSPAERSAGGNTTIVVTTTILGDVTREVAGDVAQVVTLIPLGADPHSVQPSAQQVEQLVDAHLVVTNGAGLEANFAGAIEEAEAAGVPVVEATDAIEGLPPAADSDHAGEAAHAHPEDVDPHFWLDPVRMADVVRALGDAIATAVSEGEADAVERRADAYVHELEQVHDDVTSTLASVPTEAKTLVTNHESFRYFADRYGFTVVGTVIPSVSTGAEPSARDLEKLVTTISEHDVAAVFTEATAGDQFVQILSEEIGPGVQIVELFTGSLGPEGSGAETYLEMLRTNARRISGALVPTAP